MKLLTEYIHCQWYSMTVLTMLALTLFFLMAVLINSTFGCPTSQRLKDALAMFIAANL